jgi:hypothetical protein
MSIEERISFERDLLQDKELAAECEEIEGISKATVKVHKEEQLQKDLEMIEREMAEADKLAKSLSSTTPFFKKVQQWFTPDAFEATPNAQGSTMTFASRMVLTCAVAAALALGVFLPVNNHLASVGYNEAGRLLESGSWQFNTYRGDDDIADKIDNCSALIQEGRFEETLQLINDTETAIEEHIFSLSGDDSAILKILELENAKQDLEFSKAVIYMREKKVGKAKHILKQIANSDSIRSEDAKRILKEVY